MTVLPVETRLSRFYQYYMTAIFRVVTLPLL